MAAIVAADPDGFADAYDRYAAPLFAYCSFMLPAPDDAAGAVRDTFLIAVSRLERLRDPNKLRPWLHAVARNECLRRLSATGDAPRPRKAAADGVLPPAELPASLRGEVLRACADNTPAGRADRASVAHHAGTFGPTGFPKAIGSSAPPWWRRRPRAAVAVAAVVTVAVAGALLAMLTGGGPHRAQASIVANGGGAPGAPASPGAWSTPAASSTPGGPGTSPGRPPVTAGGSACRTSRGAPRRFPTVHPRSWRSPAEGWPPPAPPRGGGGAAVASCTTSWTRAPACRRLRSGGRFR